MTEKESSTTDFTASCIFFLTVFLDLLYSITHYAARFGVTHLLSWGFSIVGFREVRLR
jgi:hypothetical protein